MALLLIASGCRSGLRYDDPQGPHYSGGPPALRRNPAAVPETLRVVSFNIEYALQVDSAIALLGTDSALWDADIILLQEMDAPSTKRVADALGLSYTYYPASFNLKYRRDVGNAVLSRWPIIEDAKLILPHMSRWVGTRRMATAATVRIGAATVRVYSAHLGTVANVSPEQRRDQLRAIIADAARYPHVILGGDMNDGGVGRVAVEAGYSWPTREGPRTAIVGRLDHIFLKGLSAAASGTVLANRHSSDHRPVWVTVVLRP